MHCVICKKDGTVFKLVKDAIRVGNRIEGGGKWKGKPHLFDIVWTEQELTPVYDENGDLTGYEETLADIATVTPPASRINPGKLPRTERIDLLDGLEEIAGYSFEQLDTYVENNVTDLASAKQYLKKLSKVSLGLAKLVKELQ